MPSLRVAALVAAALAAAAPARAEPGRVAAVDLVGRTLEPPEKLTRFLGLEPGAPVTDALKRRVALALNDLGYVVGGIDYLEGPDGVRVRIALEPARTVRHVDVRGNWPVFEDEIRRRLTVRPGSILPPDPEAARLLEIEAGRLKEFLRRDGYFDCDVDIVLKPDKRPEWVNVDVLIYLGRWARLGAVEATGARAVPPRELARPFSPKFYNLAWFGRFRPDQLRDDARDAERIYRDRGYPAARVIPEFDEQLDLDRRARSARLRLRVIEKGRVDIHFVGNHALSDKALRDKITIFTAGSYDDVELGESARELHRLYQANGFLEARITYRRQRSGDLQDITFFVDEGPQLKVRAVDLAPEVGSPPLTIDDKALRAQLATRVFPRLGAIGLGEGGYVTNVQLAQDVEKIEAHYRTLGYPEARARGEIARDPAGLGQAGVLGADVASRLGGGDAYVRFYVAEGRQERIASIGFRFTGEHQRSADELKAVMRLGDGLPFTNDALAADLKRIGALYADGGRPYVSISAKESSWNEDHTRVTLMIDVAEGPEVRFGPILVRGNFRTAESVIRADLPFSPGDRFDLAKLSAAERTLQAHGIFDNVKVIPSGLASGANPVPILVQVQERYDDWLTLGASVGYATDLGVLESLSVYTGNLLGGGGQLELRFQAAEDLSQAGDIGPNGKFWRLLSASLRYIHPHFLHPSLRGEVQGVARQENTPRFGLVKSAGFNVSLSWVPTASFRLFARYDFTFSSLQSIDFQRLPGRGEDRLQVIPDSTTTGKVTFGLVFDDRTSFEGVKNPLLPLEGTLLAATAALAWKPLGFNFENTHDFVVLSGQAQRFQPLGGGIRLIANLRVDWGFPIGEPALPAVERFFAGGDTTTRGFATDRLKTEIVQGEVSPAPPGAGYRILAQGGNIRFLGTLELQFPIGDLFGFPWAGAIFADAGSIFDTPALFAVDRDVKVSVGFSLLRILTPFGPLSFEYAYPVTQSLAEQEWKRNDWFSHWPGRIHFNWGIPILR